MKTTTATATHSAMLANWIEGRCTLDGWQWFAAQLRDIRAQPTDAVLARALGWAPRKLGKADLALSVAEQAHAAQLRPGLDASTWSVDQTARIAFILATFDSDASAFMHRLDRLADTAELNESIALYCGMPLYPGPAALVPRAREAVRSAIRPVFAALALRNPYPAEQFDDAAWNQMIVKTFFMDTPLWQVLGIEQRANPALAAMLLGLADERHAAGRIVSPELWRCVAPHATPAACVAMARVLAERPDEERLGVALALNEAGGTATALLQAECARQQLTGRAVAAGWAALSPWPS